MVTAGVFGIGGNEYGQGITNFVSHYGMKGLMAGVAGDVTYQFLDNGITRNEQWNITGYDINKALSNYDSVQSFKTGMFGMILSPIATKTTQMAVNAYGSQATYNINNKNYILDKNSPYDGKNIDFTTKPYINSRPSYRNGQVEQVWENAKNSAGKVIDPNTKMEITWDKLQPRNGQWDMGHKPEQKYSRIYQEYINNEISKQEFLDWYRNPNNYRPELPSTNRGHKYEMGVKK